MFPRIKHENVILGILIWFLVIVKRLEEKAQSFPLVYTLIGERLHSLHFGSSPKKELRVTVLRM